jgi:DNA-directed RNA polymerase subunit RPC12/RpoP
MATLVYEQAKTTTRPAMRRPCPRPSVPFAHPADECPACKSGDTCWIANDQNQYNYLCEACGRCWTVGDEGVTRVNPISCPGCEHRDACFEELRKEIATCWWLPPGQ